MSRRHPEDGRFLADIEKLAGRPVPEVGRFDYTHFGALFAGGRLIELELHGQLGDRGIRVSLFIDPDPEQIDASVAAGAPVIELHTGAYADAVGRTAAEELERIRSAAAHAARRGLIVHGGHGLNYHNVEPIAAIAEIVELNIGHAIVAQSIFDGFAGAVAKMKALLVAARRA